MAEPKWLSVPLSRTFEAVAHLGRGTCFAGRPAGTRRHSARHEINHLGRARTRRNPCTKRDHECDPASGVRQEAIAAGVALIRTCLPEEPFCLSDGIRFLVN